MNAPNRAAILRTCRLAGFFVGDFGVVGTLQAVFFFGWFLAVNGFQRKTRAISFL